MRKLRILLLTHTQLVPPDSLKGLTPEEIQPFRTEYDVVSTLKGQGHDVRCLGVQYEITPIKDVFEEWKPHVVFNLLEEFKDLRQNDAHVVAYLELLGVPYTGCHPRGLLIARDKALSKEILSYHRVPAPKFAVFPLGRKRKKPKKLGYPLIVKSLVEEGSTGISKASVVDSDDKLYERVDFIHRRLKTDAIVEEFIDGREVYASVLGNRRLEVLPAWEIVFKNKPEDEPLINTQKAKWDLEYQAKWGIDLKSADLSKSESHKLENLAKRIYRHLDLSGYARLDFRRAADGTFYFLEANPNPDLAAGEELASAAQAAGYKYPELLERLVGLALRR